MDIFTVVNWYERFGFKPTPAEAYSILQEEIGEFQSALANDNLEDILAEGHDLIWTIYGMFYALGASKSEVTESDYGTYLKNDAKHDTHELRDGKIRRKVKV